MYITYNNSFPTEKGMVKDTWQSVLPTCSFDFKRTDFGRQDA